MDNREKAIAFWLAIGGVFVIFQVIRSKSIRSSFGSFLRSASNWKILIVLFLYWSWLVGSIVLAALISLWGNKILVDTIYWIIFSSLPFLFNYDRLKKGSSAWKKLFAELFSVTIILEVVASFRPFNFFVEVVLLGILFIFTLVIAAAKDPKQTTVKKIAEICTTLIFFSMLSNGIIYIINDWTKDDYSIISMKIGLGIWLPLALIPFLFLFALIAEYESFFLRLKIQNGNQTITFKTRFYAFLIFNVHLKKLGSMGGLLNGFLSASSFTEANEFVNCKLGISRDQNVVREKFSSIDVSNIPEYEVFNIDKNAGVMMLDELIILTSPVNLSNSLFKDQVKKIFLDIAKKHKSPNFMATVYTDREVMEWNETLDRDNSIAHDMLEKRNTQLVATYVGGFDYLISTPSSEDGAYYINWFDGTFTTDPIVGDYVGIEKWKPQTS